MKKFVIRSKDRYEFHLICGLLIRFCAMAYDNEFSSIFFKGISSGYLEK